ncbi:hypothetical protein [Thermoleptolyngbya sp. M55_K2018_002]|uniref:hypothetical protein n=1 Tax=Thermoleptolyngbya sp. M55_K2018_002 TaxID=2747808 RepID=UPI001A0D4FDB|nr:hypothetical protein [Thermoleptolyngbya sp. M55_K2018_002]HIK42164.1 hypothetical protein [Thermoleptolyngbya sp. M55_K2018_002]
MQSLNPFARFALIATALAGVFLIVRAIAKNPPCDSSYPECSCAEGEAQLMQACIGQANHTIGVASR